MSQMYIHGINYNNNKCIQYIGEQIPQARQEKPPIPNSTKPCNLAATQNNKANTTQFW